MNMDILNSSFDDAAEIHRNIPEFQEDYLLDNRERIENNENLILIGKFEGENAGYCISYDRYDDSSLYIWMSGVKPEFRRKGLMTALLNKTEREAEDRGYQKLKIKTENRRRGMRQLLAQKGFDIIELDRKEEKSRNKFLMEKEI